ncbi:MAG: hypothetical protein KatS3mg065_1249 [Chloroflexota bacterium]|nr:MAG: hypothetical protein KatS3mg065_1249 [Chloroflexota bacterium]
MRQARGADPDGELLIVRISTRRARSRACSFALAVGVTAVALAGCGGGGGGGPSVSSTALPSPPTAGAGSFGSSPRPSPPASASLAPEAILGSVLDRLATTGYAVEATVVVGDVVATRATGRGVGTAVELTIEAGDTAVTYRQIGARTWVRDAGGWRELEQPAGSIDPLAQLRRPVAVEVGAVGGETVLAARYPGTELGLDVEVVPVEIRIAADGTVLVRYATTVGGRAASSETRFTPAPNQAPIVPPG